MILSYHVNQPRLHVFDTFMFQNHIPILSRMDIDQAARANAQDYFGVRDPDFYEMQAHIIVDDAMSVTADGRKGCNPYVNQLVSAMQDAARWICNIDSMSSS